MLNHQNLKKPSLYVIGIGPGHSTYLTEKAKKALFECTDIVGYSKYLEQLAEKLPNKNFHPFQLGEEVKRAQFSITLSLSQKKVALISSGDANIYGMSPVLIALLKELKQPIDVQIISGISAFQAFAEKIGAPIGHDFCLISLSNLLTPEKKILKRLEAACMTDFVICLYNPASETRIQLIQIAWKILQKHHCANTPVAIGSHITRKNEQIEFLKLRDCHKKKIHMNQIIIIGNSQTKIIEHQHQQWFFTPRGYQI